MPIRECHACSSLDPITKNRRFWAKIKGEETELLRAEIGILGMVSVSVVDFDLGIGYR